MQQKTWKHEILWFTSFTTEESVECFFTNTENILIERRFISRSFIRSKFTYNLKDIKLEQYSIYWIYHIYIHYPEIPYIVL